MDYFFYSLFFPKKKYNLYNIIYIIDFYFFNIEH